MNLTRAGRYGANDSAAGPAPEGVVDERAEEVEAVVVVDQRDADDVDHGRGGQAADDGRGRRAARVSDLAGEVPGPLEAGVDLERVHHRVDGGQPADPAARGEAALGRRRDDRVVGLPGAGVPAADEVGVPADGKPDQPHRHPDPDERERGRHVAGDHAGAARHQQGEQHGQHGRDAEQLELRRRRRPRARDPHDVGRAGAHRPQHVGEVERHPGQEHERHRDVDDEPEQRVQRARHPHVVTARARHRDREVQVHEAEAQHERGREQERDQHVRVRPELRRERHHLGDPDRYQHRREDEIEGVERGQVAHETGRLSNEDIRACVGCAHESSSGIVNP